MYLWKGFFLTFFFLWVILEGCAALGPKPDPTKFFHLASLPRTGQLAQDAAGTSVFALGIGPVKLPGYLDREEIVTRVSQNRFAVAENDRWAEPLEENFSRVLAQNLSILLQTERIIAYPWERRQQPTYQVQVEVLRFEPNAEQMVELCARWSITDNTKKTVIVRESYISHPVKDKSTEASVAALSEVVGSLSQEISANLRGLSRG